MKSRLLLLGLLFAPTAVAAGAPEGIPRPRGWIGTTEEWAQGLGIAFAVLDLILLLWLARSVRRSGLTQASKMLMFLAVVVLPLALVFFSYSHGIQASQKVEACGACHVMEPWVNNLRDPNSKTLAAVHYKNRYIHENQCYVCHSDYGMFGTIQAKWEGLGRVVRYSTGAYEYPIKIARPYPNWRCLHCHGASQKFLDPEKHPKESLADLMSGKTSCIDCHGPVHPPQVETKKRASR